MTKSKFLSIFSVIAVIVTALVAAVIILCSSPVYNSVTVEAGSSGVSVSRFVKSGAGDAYFITDVSAINFSSPDEYSIEISLDGKTYSSLLKVVDTTPPHAKTVDRFITADTTLSIWDFFSELHDATEVSASYMTEPVFGVYGKSRIIINLSDTSGNTTVVSCNLTISKLIESITLEAGSSLPDAGDFLAVDASDVKYITDTETLKTNTVKDYPITISVDGEEFTSTLKVVDTVAPVATPFNAVISTKHVLSSSELVKDIIDATSVDVYSYDERPYGKVGTYTVSITLADEGGNTTNYDITVTVTDDESLINLKDE